MMRTYKFLSLVLIGTGLLTACNKPLVTGRDRKTPPLAVEYRAPAPAAFEAAQQALRDMDYKVEYANQDEGVLRTGLMPTTADSHYLDLFGREDYGATGSYYYLIVHVKEETVGNTKVTVQAPLRTIVARMRTSHRLEKKFLSKMTDLLRPADIEVTNIGVVDKRPVAR